VSAETQSDVRGPVPDRADARAQAAVETPPGTGYGANGVRYLEITPPRIPTATDLGSVLVLKHANLYMLTDQFGDIHPDSRGLGLYRNDTRILSCASLRVNGTRLALLQAAPGATYRGAIEMTNPGPLRDVRSKIDADASPLARRTLGIRRDRLLSGALLESLRVVNHAERDATVELELQLGVDDADIFEVRGYPRPVRGLLLPVALDSGGERITFRYDGVDWRRRRTFIAFSEPAAIQPIDPDDTERRDVGGSLIAIWRWSLSPGAERTLDWRVWDEVVDLPHSAGARTGRVSLQAGAAEQKVDSGHTSVPGPAGVAESAAGASADGRQSGQDEQRVSKPQSASPESGPQTTATPVYPTGAETIEQDEGPIREGSSAPVTSHPDVDDRATLFPPSPLVRADEAVAAYHAWERGTTGVEADHELFNLTLTRSMADLRLLVNEGPAAGERYLAAGVPWFTTLFGRDSIIVSLQSLAFRPQIAIETLGVLAARQATEVDDWRDAEPGKILHELRTGEMSRAGELPFSPYYGSIDATPLWLILLGATFDWTGDRALLERFWPNALAALRWIDEWGDRDGDGFVEYERRSDRGLLNQGWKDSADAIRDRDGQIAAPPVALAEVQGYVYDAKRRMSRLAALRGEIDLSERLERDADRLRERFEAAFWMEDRRYYAMALDGQKRQMNAIGSNPGQCLWTGIVSPERARHVADTLLDRPLFSGWGIRSYAAGQPGYNPIGYHTGTIWPHDSSIIAAGLKRYGFHEEANELIGRVLEAAQQFPAYRLPELFCGFERDATGVPVPYPVACSPQAWAAGASFLFLTTMLGLHAHADRRELELLRPQLPSWLRSVRLTNLRLGDTVVDLLFHSWRGTTSAEVLRKVGDVSVTIRL
jgi:glycogen debranching enzyme